MIGYHTVANKAHRYKIEVQLFFESANLGAALIIDLIVLADRHGDNRLFQFLTVECTDFVDFGRKIARLVHANRVTVFFGLYRRGDKIAQSSQIAQPSSVIFLPLIDIYFTYTSKLIFVYITQGMRTHPLLFYYSTHCMS